MAIYNVGVIHLRFAFVGVQLYAIVWYWGHNFGSRYARKPIKGSEDSDDNLISKTP